MKNRRRTVRVDIEREAQILVPDGSVSRACKLRNLSSRGAKLVLGDCDDLPERVILYLPQEDARWPCRIVRRRQGEIGVEFL